MSTTQGRAVRTRQDLIDATVGCLAEFGYERTTTVAVCRRAGVARGTMLHHFPTKESLVVATLDDLFARRVQEFQAELVASASGDPAWRDVEALVWHLWRAIRRGPTFFAWLELALASRTDPALEAEFRAMMARFDTLVTAVTGELLPPEIAPGLSAHDAVSLTFSTLNGLALDLLQADEAAVEARVGVFARWAASIGGMRQ